MAAMLQMTFSSAFFSNGRSCILIPISLKFVPKGPFDNKSVMVQVMAWCRAGGKPLLESLMTEFF